MTQPPGGPRGEGDVVLARSRDRVHLVGEGNRTLCGQRLASLIVERGRASAVTCRTCRGTVPQ